MSMTLENKHRRMVPRWRDSATTVQSGEFEPILIAPHHEESQSSIDFLATKVQSWKENRTLAFATDLVGAALVLGRQDEAKEAAQFVLDHTQELSAAAADLARVVLGVQKTVQHSEARAEGPNLFWTSIHELRQRLQVDPRNSLAWIDLSRCYASIGLADRAQHTMELAIYLQPENRFILRSAARLLVHIDDPERAHDLLRKNPRVIKDPWLVAAEIAVSAVAGRTSKLFKVARSMLSEFDPRHVTELASAVGSVELLDGNRRQAKKLFNLALMQPTDNTVAQVAWISRLTQAFDFDPEYFKTPRSYEARSWEHYSAGNWTDALSECHRWLDDEPFSTRPAILGSFIASTELERYAESARICRIGLQANRDDQTLLNNLAFSLASEGKVFEAEREYLRIRPERLSNNKRPVWLATGGLLQFRRGIYENGRDMYKKAVELADAISDSSLAALAACFWAREEILAKTSMAASALGEALRRGEKQQESLIVQSILQRLRALHEENSGKIVSNS